MTTDESNILGEVRADVSILRIDINRGLSKLDQIAETLYGDSKGALGVVRQVQFMWKTFWLWPLCTLSGVAGVVATLLAQRFFK
jgi:hypothetical protein